MTYHGKSKEELITEIEKLQGILEILKTNEELVWDDSLQDYVWEANMSEAEMSEYAGRALSDSLKRMRGQPQ